ncbi:MAG: hypothetical protein AB7O38_01640, partial [Pirellulaceae bacterium]
MAEPRIAFLASGRLFVRDPGRDFREIESRFARESLDRRSRAQSSNAWRGRSGVWGQMGMAPPELSQWEGAEATRAMRFRCAARGRHREELFYVLDMGNVHGIFRYDLSKDTEYRLVHRDAFPASSLAVHPQGTFATSLARPDGSAALAFSKNEGRFWNEVKGGDSVDQSPAWSPCAADAVVFQSAPIARSPQGMFLGLGPYAIESLQLNQQGSHSTLVSDEQWDYLLPQLRDDGTLVCIRRPYKAQRDVEFNWKTVLTDIVLFPYRLLRALLHFFNFFSVMFAGQPLADSMGTRSTPAQAPQLLSLWGQMIDTKRAMEAADKGKTSGLVHKDWVLLQ